MPRRWSSPLSNGWTGSTIGACSSRSAISLPLKPRRATMPRSPVRPWQPDSNKIASGKPGAVHQIRLRLHQGERQKAARGELRVPLPAGLAYDRAGAIVRNPDEEVQTRLQLVFAKFTELGISGFQSFRTA